MVSEVILGLVLNSFNVLEKFRSEKHPCSENLGLVLALS